MFLRTVSTVDCFYHYLLYFKKLQSVLSTFCSGLGIGGEDWASSVTVNTLLALFRQISVRPVSMTAVELAH